VAANWRDDAAANSIRAPLSLPPRIPDASEELVAYAAGSSVVAGVDEAGRGAWAGPLVAAAVVLPDLRDGLPEALIGVNDSKLVAPTRRGALYHAILEIGRAHV
jgi:ribonuclease HII